MKGAVKVWLISRAFSSFGKSPPLKANFDVGKWNALGRWARKKKKKEKWPRFKYCCAVVRREEQTWRNREKFARVGGNENISEDKIYEARIRRLPSGVRPLSIQLNSWKLRLISFYFHSRHEGRKLAIAIPRRRTKKDEANSLPILASSTCV